MKIEITKREVLVSVIIFSVMFLIGVYINNALVDDYIDTNASYNRALKINNEESLFKQAMSTNFGEAFVYGELKAKTPVTYNSIKGEYVYIEQRTERYTEHTEIVTKTRTKEDGSTETYTEEETYWSWDLISTDSKHTEFVIFLNVEFPYYKFRNLPLNYIDTLSTGYNLRHVYYGIPDKISGTIYTKLTDNTISDKTLFTQKPLQDTVDDYLTDIQVRSIIFWVVWVIITGIVIFAFVYCENYWLED